MLFSKKIGDSCSDTGGCVPKEKYGLGMERSEEEENLAEADGTLVYRSNLLQIDENHTAPCSGHFFMDHVCEEQSSWTLYLVM